MRSTMAIGIGVAAVSLILLVGGCAPIKSSSTGLSSPAESPYERPITETTSQAEIPPPPVLPAPPADPTEEIVEETVLARSKNLGAALTSAEWQSMRATICANLKDGGPGLFLSQAANSLRPEDQWPLADLYLDGAISGTCRKAEKPRPPAGRSYESQVGGWRLYDRLQASYLVNDYEYRTQIRQYIKDVRAYGLRYDVDVSYLLAAIPELGGAYEGGTGRHVTCADGWVSSSGGKPGACSHHGGIR
ncbi:hypothetical protein [Arthrobacter sp. SW1]|uniref:hypothetical protein n=1 Tax=Arthrobacter sp. SW1 TaxID=1920889 RepID=UPI00111309D6|nr:hypothetical protein [Arthrobacter sp. SW1]